MNAADPGDSQGRRQVYIRKSISPALPIAVIAVWRWRVAGVMGVLLYVAQDLLGLRWEWLAQLQTVDAFKYVTGAGLLSYLGWQWWLSYAGLKGRILPRLLVWRQRTCALVPLLIYAHSVEMGYGYLAALSWTFFGSMLIGVWSPLGVKVNSRYLTASWAVIHVPLAALTVVVLGIFHTYIAVY